MTCRLLGAVSLAVFSACSAAYAANEPMAIAIDRFETGELEAAETLFHEQLAAEPARAAYYLGRIHFRRDDLDGAIEWLERATAEDSSDSGSQLWLGRAYLAQLQHASMFKKLGLSKKVRACYLMAIQLDPDNLSARESLAGYYFNAPRIAGGSTEKGLEQVREIKARDARRGHLMLASHYTDEESYDLAEKEYQAALALAPNEPDTLYHLGQLSQTRGDPAQAFDYFERALTADPDHRASLYAVGRTAAISGSNTEKGIECLQRYLKGEPDDNTPARTYAYWRLGMIYEHKGDTAQARRSYGAAVELDPENDRARKALEKLP